MCMFVYLCVPVFLSYRLSCKAWWLSNHYRTSLSLNSGSLSLSFSLSHPYSSPSSFSFSIISLTLCLSPLSFRCFPPTLELFLFHPLCCGLRQTYTLSHTHADTHMYSRGCAGSPHHHKGTQTHVNSVLSWLCWPHSSVIWLVCSEHVYRAHRVNWRGGGGNGGKTDKTARDGWLRSPGLRSNRSSGGRVSNIEQ